MEHNVDNYRSAFIFDWEPGFAIKCTIHGSYTLIEANKEGLVSLAKHLLELAEVRFPEYSHFHLDAVNSLEDNSSELIIVKRTNDYFGF